MAENKTVATTVSVSDFLETLPVDQQHDSGVLIAMMSEITGTQPTMWGPSIVGFGSLQYTTADGKTHDWMRIGFSPRKGRLSLYVTISAEKYTDQLDAMGKYKIGKGCIYINKLADVDTDKLKSLIIDAYKNSYDLSKE